MKRHGDGKKVRTHIEQQEYVDIIDAHMRIIVPEICGTELGKQLFNIMSRFTGYHMSTDVSRGVSLETMAYNDAMRNVYRYFRSYMPVEKLAEIEHGVYPYDVQSSKETDKC